MRHFSGDEDIQLFISDELEAIAGGNGVDTDDIQMAGEWSGVKGKLTDGVIGFLAGYFSSQANDAAGREGRVAASFSPSGVAANTYGWNGQGEHITGWEMKDGTHYWDTNKNYMPDLRTMTDSVGNVWNDSGSGWEQVRGVQ